MWHWQNPILKQASMDPLSAKWRPLRWRWWSLASTGSTSGAIRSNDRGERGVWTYPSRPVGAQRSPSGMPCCVDSDRTSNAALDLQDLTRPRRRRESRVDERCGAKRGAGRTGAWPASTVRVRKLEQSGHCDDRGWTSPRRPGDSGVLTQQTLRATATACRGVHRPGTKRGIRQPYGGNV